MRNLAALSLLLHGLMFFTTIGCSPSPSSLSNMTPTNEPTVLPPQADTAPSPAAPQTETKLWLEPSNTTVIGVGQSIPLFAVFKAQTTDLFPAYLSSTEVTWSNSNPEASNLSAEATVTGLKPGLSVLSAKYKEFSAEIKIQVSGSFIQRTINVPGQGTRKYSLYIPPDSIQTPRPLLISIHGGGGTSMMQAASSQLNAIAASKGFYVVYPQGTGLVPTFNAGACCGTAKAQNIDDILFFRRVISDLESSFLVNSSKIFATGFSNGGLMSHRLACELSDKISGIAAVSGGSGEFDFQKNRYFSCNPSRLIPVLHIHASNDRNYPFVGGSGNGVSGTDFYPISDTIADWIKRNNLNASYSIETASPNTICYVYNSKANPALPSAKVTLCKQTPFLDIFDSINEIVYGGGHSWPGGVKSSSSKGDVPDASFNASQYLWNYLN